MSAITMAVPVTHEHTHVEMISRSDTMERKDEYAATYEFGKTKVHVVAPPPKTKKEIDEILHEYHMAGWAIIREIQEKEAQSKS